MSVVISRDLVLRNDWSLPGSSPAAPMVGWDNRISRRSVAATSELDTHPAVAMGNPSTAEYWSATSSADQTITAQLTAPVEVSYLGIARHNLATAGASVRISLLVEEVWVQALPDFVPASDSVIFARFVPQMATSVRVQVIGASIAPRIAVLSAGPLLLLQRNIYVGHTPITMGRDSEVSTGISESGQFQGRIVTRVSHSTSVSMSNLWPDWYRTHMDPFVRASIELPFFFAWRPSDYPLETGYCWMRETPRPTNQSNNGMMEVTLSMQGITERDSAIIILDPMRSGE